MAVNKNQSQVVDTRKKTSTKSNASASSKVSVAKTKPAPSVTPTPEPVPYHDASSFGVKEQGLREIPQAISNIMNRLDAMNAALSNLMERTNTVTQQFPIQPLHVPEAGDSSTTLGNALLSIEYRLQNITTTMQDLDKNIQL